MKIIRQLNEDGRKTIRSISQETGISSRTIKKRIDFMLKNGLIENEVDFYLGVSGDIWFASYVRLNDPASKDRFFDQMSSMVDTCIPLDGTIPTLLTLSHSMECSSR